MSTREIIQEDQDPGWMMTYADLMTLLLVFFVLLFSISTVKKEQFASTIRSFQLAIGESGGSLIPLPEELRAPAQALPDVMSQPDTDVGSQPEAIIPQPEVIQVPVVPEVDKDAPLKPVEQSLKDVFSTMGVKDVVEVGAPKNGKINIRVKGEVLFQSGDAAFDRNMMPILDGLLETLESNPDLVLDIQGHTDNVPIETTAFPSNWELSAVRATTVLRYLVRGGINPERLTATGYGDALPIASNNSFEGRAENRRIEFVLEKVEKP